jgi:hypothetical protein
MDYSIFLASAHLGKGNESIFEVGQLWDIVTLSDRVIMSLVVDRGNLQLDLCSEPRWEAWLSHSHCI